MEAEAAIINSNSEKSLMARAALDKTEYMGKIGMQFSGSQAKTTITPILQFKTPSNTNNDPNMMQLSGKYTSDPIRFIFLSRHGCVILYFNFRKYNKNSIWKIY